VLSEIRKDYPNILVADAGNFLFRSTRLSSITQVGDMVAAQYVAKGMSLVKYDVANIGPNDLAAGLDFLLTIKKDASFTIISSNVVSTKTNTPIFEASVVKTIGGVKVGFFGIAGTDASGAYDKETFTFADPQETGKKMVAELSKKATVIVALLAMDRKDAYDFAAAVPGIDLIVTTSQPQPIPIPKLSGTAYMASGDEKGKRLGRATIVVGPSRPYKITGEIIPIGSLINREPSLNKLEYDYYKWLKDYSPASAGEPPDTKDE
jgi:2',3'-cyclic-nucleotide 2'-phosphodiesterase (5'-nucleotidase family)